VKEAYNLWRSIPSDVLIGMCLFCGALARLTRDETISVLSAAKEFYFALIVGAVLTGISLWLTGWEMRNAWWIALGAPIAYSVIVEIMLKRAHEIRDMDWKEFILFLIDEIKKRFFKQATP
jgi:hypothetical protein